MIVAYEVTAIVLELEIMAYLQQYSNLMITVAILSTIFRVEADSRAYLEEEDQRQPESARQHLRAPWEWGHR